MIEAGYWIEHLGLVRHPEGGYYRETYRSREFIRRAHLPERFDGDRSFSTAIYFLLPAGEFSAFHRIRQDEIWHFYEGASLTIHTIDERGDYATAALGRDAGRGERHQAVVPAGTIFGATVASQADDALADASLAGESAYALAGCTVAPGFDFADFEILDRGTLLRLFPRHRSIIEALTHPENREKGGKG